MSSNPLPLWRPTRGPGGGAGLARPSEMALLRLPTPPPERTEGLPGLCAFLLAMAWAWGLSAECWTDCMRPLSPSPTHGIAYWAEDLEVHFWSVSRLENKGTAVLKLCPGRMPETKLTMPSGGGG